MREIPGKPYPIIEMTGEEILASGNYSVLDVDEEKAVGVQPYVGLTYVVRRKGCEGLNLAVLVPIDPKRLRRRQPRLSHPLTCRDDVTHTPNMEQHQAAGCSS